MCMHARMRRLVWSGDGTYVRRRRPWPARGKICACAFLVYIQCLQTPIDTARVDVHFRFLYVYMYIHVHELPTT